MCSGPLNCRGGCYFCLDTKVTKKSSQQKGFFAARGPLPCKQAKPRTGNNCPSFHSAQGPALLQIFPIVPPGAQGHHVLPVSAEADLLTVLENIIIIYTKKKVMALCDTFPFRK